MPVLGAAGLLLAVIIIAVTGGSAHFWSAESGPGAFYKVIPYVTLAAAGIAASAYIAVAVGVGSVRFWRDIAEGRNNALDRGAWWAALVDVATLANLKGGGAGCYQPDPMRAGDARRLLHQSVVYGFALAFLSTALAACAQDVLGILPPYPFWSAPVLTGSIGGLLMVVGCTGLLWLKAQSTIKAPILISRSMASMDSAFVIALNLAALTGLLTLALRSTGAMGTILTLHIASLVALYATAPYGKFVHSVYRFEALLKHRAGEHSEWPLTVRAQIHSDEMRDGAVS